VIVLRHPETGSAAIAAKAAKKPIINAGDGVGEHPTQALLDTFTIQEEIGRLDNLTVTMLGDLKYGRTVHSLSRLLSSFNNIKLNYVSPDILKMPKEVMDEVAQKKVPQAEFGSLEKVLPETDVLYVTRVQKERFEDPADYDALADHYLQEFRPQSASESFHVGAMLRADWQKRRLQRVEADLHRTLLAESPGAGLAAALLSDSPAAKLLARTQRQIAAFERCWHRANTELRRARRQSEKDSGQALEDYLDRFHAATEAQLASIRYPTDRDLPADLPAFPAALSVPTQPRSQAPAHA